MALVLSRKQNETICLGEHVRMTVRSIKGNNVRIGFSAPQGVKVPEPTKLRTGESVDVGGGIKVFIAGVKGSVARFAVHTSKHIRIDRLEIRERKDMEMNPRNRH